MHTRFIVSVLLVAGLVFGFAAPQAALAQPGLPSGVKERLESAAQRGREALEKVRQEGDQSESADSADTTEGTEGTEGTDATDSVTPSWDWSRTVTVEANGDLDQRDAVFHKPRCTSARIIVDGREVAGTVSNGRLPLWVCPAKFKNIPVHSTVRIIIEGEYNGQKVHGEETFKVGAPPRIGSTVHVGTVLLRVASAKPNPAPTCPKKAIGDANCDGAVNTMDYAIWMQESSGQRNAKTADFNGDGIVNQVDGDIVKAHLGE